MRQIAVLRWLPLFVAAWLAAETAVSAQTRLVGIVRDENSDPIQGATVTAENVDRTFTATTDEGGNFGFITLRPGNWILTASAPGFTPTQQRQRVRAVARNPSVDFFLARGAYGQRFGALAGVDSVALQDQLQAAEALSAGGQDDEAIVAYEAVAAMAPALTTVRLKLGDLYLRTERYTEAEEAYQAILAADADLDLTLSRELFYSFGETRLALQSATEATGWYWRAHESDPAWSKPLLKLGELALEAGDQSEARHFLLLAIEAEPGSDAQATARALLAEIPAPPQ